MRRGIGSIGSNEQQQESAKRMKQQRWWRNCVPHGARRLWRVMWSIQVVLAILVAVVMITSGGRLYKERDQSQQVGADKLAANVGALRLKVGKAMEAIQSRIQHQLHEIGDRSEWLQQSNLLLDIAMELEKIASQLKNPNSSSSSYGGVIDARRHDDDGHFAVEEMNKYLLPRAHRFGGGKKNFMGTNATQPSIGLACASSREMRRDLEKFMSYDVGDYCPDDWPLGQRLMAHGCDPLPRRRCLARAPQLFSSASLAASSAWRLPDDRNVRWSNYRCKSFTCLASKNSSAAAKGFFKCAECFDLEAHEFKRWMNSSSSSPASAFFTAADFTIDQVLSLKPKGELRGGLDFSVGTGSFAARMRERNVTIVSATLNLGAPFNEAIALRGLVPLYLSVNQRLPFFDNTLDMIHTTLFLDGWIDHILLDFIIFDWDRVLRPGGLLWIDRFFCTRDDLEDYLYFFLQLHYKKHLWVVAPKRDRDGKEVYFSAVLEKPGRPF